ncbi:MAG: hypothetical protein COX65_02525 [Elusimicrobia bacterium CG_4_10_14_0_2_um_filter_56_8]|nr:MAG: hypothetical protein AUJ51_08325 [Elusimicrobia bacterium CG1_02_56_21]PJA16401.1 MAG: hypothetical protein COX65_02525 [Elusimicrobia bacterium CG_4_10_14_0_2_um_filter_56_8]
MRQTKLILLAALFCASPAAAGENVSFTVTPPAGRIRLADSFKFTVAASIPEKYTLRPDTAAPEDSGFELLSVTKSSEIKKDGLKTEFFEVSARAFTLGISTFPAISWSLAGAAGAAGSVFNSAPFNLEVLPLFKTKEGEGIRDIYPPFRYLPWLWLIALALAAAGAFYLYLRRRRAKAGGLSGPGWTDSRTPYQRARDRLEKLEKSPLAAAGRLKEFYIGMTTVLRLYLAEEFSIGAALMTTSALARELKRTGADIKTTLRARELLKKSDLVKFARLKPEDSGEDSRALEELLTEFHRAAENARALAEAEAAKNQAGGRP